MSIASTLDEAVSAIAQNPDARVIRFVRGAPASAAALERAAADRITPSTLLDLYSEMDGLTFEWGLAPRRKNGRVKRLGFISIPTLARNLQGWSFDDGFATEFPRRLIRIFDESPFTTGCMYSPCAVDGEFGLWNRYDDVFDPNLECGDYYARAAECLFIPGWLDAECQNETLPKTISVARERLGLPPLEQRIVGDEAEDE